ncbi:MAG: DUF3613 domain-containing protein [Rhodanobacter sp.]
MNTHAVSVQYFIALAVVTLALSVPMAAVAQQQPLTGQMVGGQTDAASNVATPQATQGVPSATQRMSPPLSPDDAVTYNPAQFGDTTRHLLQLQVDGSLAGKRLPMLGSEASASYQRYLKSFEYPIPEYMKTSVAKNADNGR